jgi:glycosyltransferase involved in cell wall biosynthesis
VRLTILHTESSLGLGGQERRTLRELELIDRERFRPLYLCQPGARSAALAKELGVPVFHQEMRSSYSPPGIARIARLLRRERVDIIHTHSSRDAWLAGAAGRITGTPVVRTRHLWTPIGGPFVYKHLADRVLTVSGEVGRYLVSRGVPEERVIPIPTGVNLERFDPGRTDLADIRAEFGIPADAFLLGMVAVLRKGKGHRFVIQAVKELLPEFPRLRLIIAGDGPQWDNLNRLVDELELRGRVILAGARQDIPDLLKALDLFVLPSRWEALGTALLEAQAMGVPVLASDVGGIPEAVGDGGRLMPPHDGPAVTAGIRELLQRPQELQTMGRRGRRRVRERFDQRGMVHAIEQVYRQMAGRG